MPSKLPETRSLRRRHALALGIVAVLTLLGQGVIQFALWRHEADAGFINIAGRQRMWSQRIVQLALRAAPVHTPDAQDARAVLPPQIEAWLAAHDALLHGNSGLGPVVGPDAEVRARLQALEPAMGALVEGVNVVLAARAPGSDAAQRAMADVLIAQDSFLGQMDDTVFHAAKATNGRVRTLRAIELIQFLLVLVTLLAEGRFILRPALRAITRSLVWAQAAAEARGAAEAAQAAMVAALPDRLVRVDAEGRPVAVLADPRGRRPVDSGLWDADGVPEPAVARLVDLARATGGVAGPEDVALVALADSTGAASPHERQADALSDSMEAFEVIEEIRVVGLSEGALVLARDVTEARRAERTLFAAEEAARRMVGRDLHDGLCQELAALHYLARSLASRAARNGSVEAEPLDRLAAQLEHTVEAGRRLSRGLYPLDLEVGGLGLALQALAERATVPGGPTVLVAVSDDEDLPSDVALQLYRIAQEAVANALRHARSSRLSLRFEQVPGGGHRLTISDNGRGNTAPPSPIADHTLGRGPGRGLGRGLGRESMARRAALIGARLDVTLSADAGTRVQCFVPAQITARGNT